MLARHAALVLLLSFVWTGPVWTGPVWTGPVWTAPAQPADTLRLSEAFEEALAHNYRVQVARTEARIARNDVTIGNADLLPRLSVRATQSRRPTGSFVGGGTQFGQASAFDASASLQWTVFDGLERFAVYDQLGALREQAEQEAYRTEEVLLAEVTTAYYDLARQQRQMDVLREAVGLSEERLRIAQRREEIGSGALLDVRQAQIALNEDRAAVLQQESALVQSRAVFNQLLGRPAPAAFVVSETIDVGATYDLETLEATAVQQNRAVQAAEAARAVAAIDRRVARAAWWPEVDLTAGYGLNDVASGAGLPVNQPGGFSYGLTASFDLFDGFNRSRRVENAQLRLRARTYALDEVRTRVRAELVSALERYRNARRRAALEEANLDAARLNVEVALERFRLGTISSVELREVQNTLIGIQSRLLAARFEAKRAEAVLLLLSGRLRAE